MRVIKMEDWPWPVRVLVTMAQNKANDTTHGATTTHHVAWALLEMPVMRALFEDKKQLQSVDIAVQKGLLTTPKAGVKKALLTVQLEGLLGGEGERTTAAFLRGALIQAELLPLVDAMAALLDRPVVTRYCTEIASQDTLKELPGVFLGFHHARELKHRDLTTRHGILGTLIAIDKTCIKHNVGRIEDAVARMRKLLLVSRMGDGVTVNFTPRFVGAVAAACASEKPALAFFGECVREDDAVAFAVEAHREASVRIREAVAAAGA